MSLAERNILNVTPNLWTLTQLDAIERRYPTREVKALVAEIRRLNVIATRAGDVLVHLERSPTTLDNLPNMVRLMVLGLQEVCDAPATGKRQLTPD